MNMNPKIKVNNRRFMKKKIINRKANNRKIIEIQMIEKRKIQHLNKNMMIIIKRKKM